MGEDEAGTAPGGVWISEDAFRQVHGKVAADFADLGGQILKNIARRRASIVLAQKPPP
jgi:hypothetical protein